MEYIYYTAPKAYITDRIALLALKLEVIYKCIRFQQVRNGTQSEYGDSPSSKNHCLSVVSTIFFPVQPNYSTAPNICRQMIRWEVIIFILKATIPKRNLRT